MSTTGGTIVNGSAARFYPFGGYRTTPTAGLTDRGFTGHKQNDEIGLTYMNARYYVPGIGRFASADTIIPNPQNPQSYNRYSYVRNNPLGLTDPTGHRECEDDDCSAFEPPLPKPEPLVDFTGEGWTSAEKQVVNEGAWIVARALANATGGALTPREAFLAVYGGTVEFAKTGVLAKNLGKAEGSRLINVNRQSDGATITGAGQGTMWVAHELGHAFNNALSPNITEPGYSHGQGLIDLAQEGVRVNGVLISGATNSTSWLGDYTRDFRGYQSDTSPYIQNDSDTASEDFADMFSNYAHNSFASNIYGQARYDFMSNHMSSWIALAVANNE